MTVVYGVEVYYVNWEPKPDNPVGSSVGGYDWFYSKAEALEHFEKIREELGETHDVSFRTTTVNSVDIRNAITEQVMREV